MRRTAHTAAPHCHDYGLAVLTLQTLAGVACPGFLTPEIVRRCASTGADVSLADRRWLEIESCFSDGESYGQPPSRAAQKRRRFIGPCDDHPSHQRIAISHANANEANNVNVALAIHLQIFSSPARIMRVSYLIISTRPVDSLCLFGQEFDCLLYTLAPDRRWVDSQSGDPVHGLDHRRCNVGAIGAFHLIKQKRLRRRMPQRTLQIVTRMSWVGESENHESPARPSTRLYPAPQRLCSTTRGGATFAGI